MKRKKNNVHSVVSPRDILKEINTSSNLINSVFFPFSKSKIPLPNAYRYHIAYNLVFIFRLQNILYHFHIVPHIITSFSFSESKIFYINIYRTPCKLVFIFRVQKLLYHLHIVPHITSFLFSESKISTVFIKCLS
jgi:hypothetical protein